MQVKQFIKENTQETNNMGTRRLNMSYERETRNIYM